ELLVHLQLLGKYISATAVIDYLAQPDVQQCLKLTKTISLATAQHWMENCGFRWTTAQNRQYVNDHKQEDIVRYQQNQFLPAWYEYEEGQEIGQWTVVWFHDESTFYANDWCKKCWVHTEEKATPQPKGKGSSLMVADF
ncbi:uncharacterized protein EDB91DRAFT_1031290, partial [Suillus paluster]|uniref:uncharacterized protein n=1 Tax=Suillus paluster TaxID=48578 RepID=UPI001B88645A